MKVSEIIAQAVHVRLPDAAQIREKCGHPDTPPIAARRKPRLVTRLAAVAALAVLLTLSTLAAVQLRKTFVERDDNNILFISPVERFPMSEELRRYLVTACPEPADFRGDEPPHARYFFRLSSLDRAEEFFGVKIAENALLELSTVATGCEVLQYEDGSGQVVLHPDIPGTSAGFIQIVFYYGTPGEVVEDIHARYQKVLKDTKPYISPQNGIEAQISDRTGKFDENGEQLQHALFCHDNVVYWVQSYDAPHRGGYSFADYYATIEEIIDAFA